MENVEVIRGRPPGDVDVVSVINRPPNYEQDDKWLEFTIDEVYDLLFEAQKMKCAYHCDAYIIDMNEPGDAIVDTTRFWFGLFTHQKSPMFGRAF